MTRFESGAEIFAGLAPLALWAIFVLAVVSLSAGCASAPPPAPPAQPQSGEVVQPRVVQAVGRAVIKISP